MDAEELRDHAEARYLSSLKRERMVRDQWEQAGCPMTDLGGATGSALVVHPLLAELRTLEIHSERLARVLIQKKSPERGGRPKGAASSKDRRPRPASSSRDEPKKLRAVK